FASKGQKARWLLSQPRRFWVKLWSVFAAVCRSRWRGFGWLLFFAFWLSLNPLSAVLGNAKNINRQTHITGSIQDHCGNQKLCPLNHPQSANRFRCPGKFPNGFKMPQENMGELPTLQRLVRILTRADKRAHCACRVSYVSNQSRENETTAIFP